VAHDPRDQLYFSKKARQVAYVPKPQREYQRLLGDRYMELGRLQPDLNSSDLVAKVRLAKAGSYLPISHSFSHGGRSGQFESGSRSFLSNCAKLTLPTRRRPPQNRGRPSCSRLPGTMSGNQRRETGRWRSPGRFRNPRWHPNRQASCAPRRSLTPLRSNDLHQSLPSTTRILEETLQMIGMQGASGLRSSSLRTTDSVLQWMLFAQSGGCKVELHSHH
jgi:hypothetical protein